MTNTAAHLAPITLAISLTCFFSSAASFFLMQFWGYRLRKAIERVDPSLRITFKDLLVDEDGVFPIMKPNRGQRKFNLIYFSDVHSEIPDVARFRRWFRRFLIAVLSFLVAFAVFFIIYGFLNGAAHHSS